MQPVEFLGGHRDGRRFHVRRGSARRTFVSGGKRTLLNGSYTLTSQKMDYVKSKPGKNGVLCGSELLWANLYGHGPSPAAVPTADHPGADGRGHRTHRVPERV